MTKRAGLLRGLAGHLYPRVRSRVADHGGGILRGRSFGDKVVSFWAMAISRLDSREVR